MRYLLAVFTWLAAAIPCLAQPVAIRTGEHADFTRVVLTIPIGAEWQLGRDAEGYILQLPVADGYDTRRFFDLIPKNRISTVSQDTDAGQLRLGIACDCYADAFLYRPDILVIDMRDGSPPPQSPFEMVFGNTTTQPFPASGSGFVVPQNPVLPIILPQQPLVFGKASAMAEPAETVITDTSTLDADLNALEQAVTESLSRALSQGLLDVEMAPSATDAMPNDALRTALGDLGLQSPGINALTSVDRNAIPLEPVVNTTQEGDRCLPDTYFDVGSWGDDSPFQSQISMARGQLTGEFDRTDENAVTELARRYLFFGFGREAEQVLQIDGARSLERRYLIALARIIDDRPTEQNLFVQQISCSGPVSLWAVLAHRRGPMDATVNRDAVLRSFRDLPLVLQSHLGPRLAQRFIMLGDTYAATQVLTLTRSEEYRPIAADLAETALVQALGAPLDAVAALTDMAKNDPRMTAEAMQDLLVESIQNGVAVRDEDLLLADALRFENARLPVADDLAMAQIRALLAMDRFVEAQSLINEVSNAIDPERVVTLSVEYAEKAIVNMSDADFLRFAVDDIPAPLPDTLADQAATRLLDLGFPDQAARLIYGDGGETRKYLRAKIALALDDPAGAIAALGNSDTEQANELRRVAEDLMYSDAILPDLTVSGGTIDGLWRRGDWNTLAQSEDLLMQGAASAVLAREELELASDEPLSDGRALLDRTAQSRKVLNELLDRFEPPEEF